MHTLTERSLVVSRAGKLGSGQGTSDEALIRAIAVGDQRAMHALYVRHSVRVYRFLSAPHQRHFNGRRPRHRGLH